MMYFVTTTLFSVMTASQEGGNIAHVIPDDTDTISDSIKFKTGLTNADFSGLNENLVKTAVPSSSEATNDSRMRLMVKNNTYNADGSAQSKDSWETGNLGYIRFENAGSVYEQDVDVLLNIDNIIFYDWEGTKQNRHANNETGEWLVFGEILDDAINFSGSKGTYTGAGQKKYFWFGEMEICVTTKIVYSGTEDLVEEEQFLQVVSDLDMNHTKNKGPTSTTGQYTVEGFKTISGFTGDYYHYGDATWEYESLGTGSMYFYARAYNSSINLKGRDSFTKGAVYMLTEGAEFSSIYLEGDCGAQYQVYLMHTPGINIDKSTDTTKIYHPGDEVTYTISLTMGRWLVDTFAPYQSLSVTDNLPSTLSLVSATISDTSVGSVANSGSAQTVQFDNSWLQDESHYDGGTYILTVVARISDDAVIGESITNTATAILVPSSGTPTTSTDDETIPVGGYKVTHEFISGTPGKDLPQEVLDRLPGDQTGKKDGEEVTPTSFDKTEIKKDGGTWTFISWDAENKTIDKADQEFIGVWVFVEDEPDTPTPNPTPDDNPPQPDPTPDDITPAADPKPADTPQQDPAPKPADAPRQATATPVTGDAGVLLWGLLLIAALAGTAICTKRFSRK